MSQLNNISQREKNLILEMHKNLYASKPIPKETKLPISEQLSEIIGELEFQKKVHIHRLSRMNENEKVEYLNNVEETLLKIFKDNNTITENYNSRFRENLVESELDPNQRIDRFNHFFLENFKIEFFFITEGKQSSLLKEAVEPFYQRNPVSPVYDYNSGRMSVFIPQGAIPVKSLYPGGAPKGGYSPTLRIDQVNELLRTSPSRQTNPFPLPNSPNFSQMTQDPSSLVSYPACVSDRGTVKKTKSGQYYVVTDKNGYEGYQFYRTGKVLKPDGKMGNYVCGGKNGDKTIVDGVDLFDAWWKKNKPEATSYEKQQLQSIQTQQQKLEKAGEVLVNAINYIKEKGLEWVMENIRSALMSAEGAMIQMAISFTGVGNIATMIVWGVMALYDAYQIFNNGAGGYWLNLIVDIICILTAGWGVPIIRPYLSKAAGAIGQGIKGVIEWMAKTGLAKQLSGKVQLIIEGAGTLIGWLKSGADFMVNKMGIKWVRGLVDKISTAFDDMVKWIKNFPEWSTNLVTKGGQVGAQGFVKLASALPASMRSLIRNSQILAQKFAPETFERFVNLSPEELGQFLGKTTAKTGVETVKKTVTSAKEQTVQGVLDIIDGTLGTGWGDGYAAYLGGRKIFQWRGGKWQSISQNVATDMNPLGTAKSATYTPDQSQKISRAGNISLSPL